MSEPAGYELWVWVVREVDGREGAIAMGVIGLPGLTVLQSRIRGTAERMRPLAEEHARSSGRPVRLAHLVEQRG